ncbi:MAG: phosphatase PAP2 family protein [Patescibacteria group bacterium]|nr:phosphatase PAP2 family protein [Patescibacteria group bacterium]
MDFRIVEFFNHLQVGNFINQITAHIVWVTFLIIFYLVLIALAYFFDKQNRKIIILTVVVAFVIDILITSLFFKGFLDNYCHLFRLQPWMAYPNDIIAIGKTINSSSFPSAHMSNILAVLTVFVYYWRKTWLWFSLFALLMAFSLMHNGVHYPTDILAGSILGFLYGLGAIYLVKKIIKKK